MWTKNFKNCYFGIINFMFSCCDCDNSLNRIINLEKNKIDIIYYSPENFGGLRKQNYKIYLKFKELYSLEGYKN